MKEMGSFIDFDEIIYLMCFYIKWTNLEEKKELLCPVNQNIKLNL